MLAMTTCFVPFFGFCYLFSDLGVFLFFLFLWTSVAFGLCDDFLLG